MVGIESNAEKHQVFPHSVRKAAMQDSKIIGRSKAKIGKRTSGVDKCYRNDPALQFGKADAIALLVDKSEIRNGLADLQCARIVVRRGSGFENFQLARSHR